MESAPLTKARDHARAAAIATHNSDPTVAINEHALAAGEFSVAAKTVSSAEACRTLKLLEQHHQRLSELLKLPAETQPQSTSESDEKETPAPSATAADQASVKEGKERIRSTATSKVEAPRGTPSLATANTQRRYPQRDLTSSIASNLASARGIRSQYRAQPLNPSVSVDQAPGNVEVQPRRGPARSKVQNMLDQAGRPQWTPPEQSPRKRQAARTGEARPSADNSTGEQPEEGYSRFYNTFGSLINRLSAPLAFAGLPLIAEEPTTDMSAFPPLQHSSSSSQVSESPSPKKNRSRHPQTVSVDPDLTKIYSRAALRAITREGHPASESFYLVPTSGHTVSYANILSFADKEKRRLEASTTLSQNPGEGLGGDDDYDDEDFVDARESPASLSPMLQRRIGKLRPGKDLSNTIEELYLENKSLKDMLDKLSRRLHAFEASAQTSSLALAESIRLMRPGSPLANAAAGTASQDEVAAMRKTQAELEEKLKLALQHVTSLEKDNSKMQRSLANYRDKWDKLKESAKARRNGQQQAAAGNEDAGPS